MKNPLKTPEEVQALLRERIPEGLVVAEHTSDAHFYRHTPSGLLLPSVTAITGLMPAPHLKKWAVGIGIDYLEGQLEAGLTLNGQTGISKELRSAIMMAHDDMFHDAGDIGTQGHKIIEAYLDKWMTTKNRPEDITSFIIGEDRRLWAITRSAQKFCHDFMAIPVASELLLANPKDGYAGTMDALMYLAFPIKEGMVPMPGMAMCSHEICQVNSHWDRLECGLCGKKWQYELTLVDWKTSNTVFKDEYYMQATAYWKALKVMTGIASKRLIIVRIDKDVEKYEPIEVLDRAGTYRAFMGLRKAQAYLKRPEESKVFGFNKREQVAISKAI